MALAIMVESLAVAAEVQRMMVVMIILGVVLTIICVDHNSRTN